MQTSMCFAIAAAFTFGCNEANQSKDASSGNGKGDDPTMSSDASIDASVLPACANPVSGTRITFRSIGDIGPSALLATSPPGDPRLFVVAQEGTVRIFKNDHLQPGNFIDLRTVLAAGGERGLLGLAFHPQYAANGLFFAYYTTATRNVVVRCSVSANPDVANPTCVEVLSWADPFSNHNGGMIEFGSDGLLYIGTGDGGSAGDPQNNGQSATLLLGKMLRIDVDNKAPGKQYGIPSANPFATSGGAKEILFLGLRNPWRWSFDRMTGDLWIADVGQDEVEELTVIPAANINGAAGTPRNLGWRKYEGRSCFSPPCSSAGMTMPQHERVRATGWASITGGQVYRGTCYPDIVGQYFFADYVAGDYARATLQSNGTLSVQDLPGTLPAGPASLHADARGELYLTTTSGGVFHLEASL